MADESFNVDFNLVMLTDNDIKTIFIESTLDTTKGYVIGVFTTNDNQAEVLVEDLLDEDGNSVLDSVDVGYNDMSTAGNYVLDFTATQGKFFGIKNIDPGIYTLSINFDNNIYEDIDVQIKVEADKVVSVIGPAPVIQ